MLQLRLVNIFISLFFIWSVECQPPPAPPEPPSVPAPPPAPVVPPPPPRCDFRRTDIPTQLRLDTRFTDFVTHARSDPIKALCLCVRNTGEISFCEDRDICPSDQILASIQSISGDRLTVRMLGGFRRKYIAMGFTNDEDDSNRDGELVANAMSSGAPAFMCGFDVAEPKPRGTPATPSGTPEPSPHFTMGYLARSYRFQRYYGAEDPNTGLVSDVTVELADGLIMCQFTINNRRLRKNLDVPVKPETGNPIDTRLDRVYVVMAQGSVNYLKDISPTCWQADPQIHMASDRHKSRYKFNIHRQNGGDQSEQYEKCSGRKGVARRGLPDYCLAFGRDGCLGLTFDCPFFLSARCDACVLSTTPGASTGELTFHIESKTFTSFVGVGFSITDVNDRNMRVENLRWLIICIPIDSSTSGFEPQNYEVLCTTTDSRCIATKASPVMGNGETKYQIACDIRLPLENFAGIVNEPVTVFMVGSNEPIDIDAESFEFVIQDKEFPEGAFFSPHHVTFVDGKGIELYRNDFVLQDSLEPDSAELEAVLNLNPIRQTKGGSSISKSWLRLLLLAQIVKLAYDFFYLP